MPQDVVRQGFVMSSTMSPRLEIELLADGGIRIEPPDSRGGGLATVRTARAWMDAAASRGSPVLITGAVESPMGSAVVEAVRRGDADLQVVGSEPEPWAKGWTSLQVAASNGLDEQVQDLLERGASTRVRRRDQSPYRLAMQRGHVPVLQRLRAAGEPAPPGSDPPPDLPNAVVFRNYLPEFVRWFAIGAGVLGIAGLIALRHWAWLIVALFGVVAIVIANLIIGRTRIAIDGPMLSVRQVVRWQGPVDLRELVALGYAPTESRRMSARWRFVQTHAGPAFGPTAHGGFDRPLVEELRRRQGLRVVTIYSGRGFMSPGLERHLAHYVAPNTTLISSTAQAALDGADVRRPG